MQKILLVEFIGTFMLILIGAGTAAAGHGGVIGAALAHGFVVTSVIYMFGGFSGAHINPAVSFAAGLSKRLPWRKVLPYWVSQLLGGISAAALLIVIFGGTSNGLGATVLAPGISIIQGLVIEVTLTFLLVTAVFQAGFREKAGSLAGFVIGTTLIALILLGGPLTGAALNPARTLGPALFSGTLNLFWLYLIGPFLGAALAAGFDLLLHSRE